MKKPTVVYNPFDVVLVPFPFIDVIEHKRRPALIISSVQKFNIESGACVMAMITSANHNPWPLDTEINELEIAGLPVQSIIRMKLFTLDQRLILKNLGNLSNRDRKLFSANLKQLFDQ